MQKPQILSMDTPHKKLVEVYEKEGYLVLKDFYQPAECQRLMQRMQVLVSGCDLDELGAIFCAEQSEHLKTGQDNYFRKSGDKIHFFLEKGAELSKQTKPEELMNKLNKVGHALHDLDPVFSQFSRKPSLASLTQILGVRKPLLLQSMYIFKPPRIGGEVRSHQDSSYIYTEPESLIGFWIALEDATLENGCLMVAPGSHQGALRERYHYQNEDLVMDALDSAPLADACLPLEVTQGTLVALHGRVAHRSCANISDKSRHAYTLHVIDGETKYLADNWLRRSTDMPLRGF